MGARTQEAVTIRSKQKSIDLIRLLGILAMGANDDTGIVDPAPNRQTLAQLLECEERTITNRIKKLIVSGELEQLRVGSGPGNPSAFRIKLEISETTLLKGKAKGEILEQKGESEAPKGEKSAQNYTDLLKEMGEIRELIFTLSDQIITLKGEILELKGERGKAKGGKGESERGKGHSSKNAHDPYDPYIDPFKERKTYIYEHPDPDENFHSLITALSGICKTTYWAKTEAEYSSAAAVLLADGVTPERVKEFGAWWSANGHYVGKPALTSVMGNWSNFVDGVTAPSANGKKALCPDCGKEQHGAVCLFCAGIIQH